MAKTGAKAGTARKPGGKLAARAVGPAGEEEKAFTRSLIAHGQAVRLAAGEPLPPGATHELVEDETGELRPVRRRFSSL